jgi:hypothetical protein
LVPLYEAIGEFKQLEVLSIVFDFIFREVSSMEKTPSAGDIMPTSEQLPSLRGRKRCMKLLENSSVRGSVLKVAQFVSIINEILTNGQSHREKSTADSEHT